MKTLMNNLLLFDSLNEQQIKFFNHLIQEVQLKEGAYFAEPGNTCSQLAFVESGILRYNYYNREAENITSSLIGEGNYIASSGPLHRPFIQSDYLQAITACSLSVITKSGMDELSSTVSNWDNILRKISQKATAERRRRIICPTGSTSPEVTAARYLAKFPNIGKHINVNQMLPYIYAQVND
jgi:CRP-like cAMP-binding protein